jgi:parallel beta-helix repeat protein
MRRWVLPLVVLAGLGAAPAALGWRDICCSTQSHTDIDSLRVWSTVTVDSAKLTSGGLLVTYPRAQVDSTKPLKCLEEYVVTLDKENVSLVDVDSPNDTVNASVTHCGGIEAPNVKMTWTSRDTDVFTVQSTTSKKVGLTAVDPGSAYLHATSDGGGADSALVLVTSAGGCVGGPTTFCPGDDLAAKVNAAAAGASFTFTDGTYQFQSITPKANQTFRGDPASPGDVVMTGARVLTGCFVASGTWWACGGQTQNNTDHDTRTCASGHPGCNLPEQLWVEDSLYERLTTKAAVLDNAQTWFFDLATDSIYINRDPTGLDIETSVTPQAFSGTASGVTIKGITVKRYATGIGNGTIDANATWLVDSVVVRENNGTCIRIDGANTIIRFSTTSRCGMQGIGGPTGDNLLVYRNVIDSNNTAQFGSGGGDAAMSGLKVSGGTGGIIRRNTVRGNNSMGLWCDIDCIDYTIDSNTVTGNVRRGIQYEISWGCDISYNTVTGNATGETGAAAAGIWISTSTDCNVHHNTVNTNRVQIMASDVDRGSGLFGTFMLTGLRVQNNVTAHTSGTEARGYGIQDQSSSRTPTSAAADNDYLNNTYTCDSGTRWLRGTSQRTKTQWVSTDGQDPGSTFSGC